MTYEEIFAKRLYNRLGRTAPIRTGNLVNHIKFTEMKNMYKIVISAKRYNENYFRYSIRKNLPATYAGKAPKGREKEPIGVVKRQRSKTTKYYKYDYAYVTEMRNRSSKGWVTKAITKEIRRL